MTSKQNERPTTQPNPRSEAETGTELESDLSMLPPPATSPLSPTLAVLENEGRPAPSTVCRVCPHALWFATQTGQACFCRIMQDQTYNDRSPNTAVTITHCDGLLLIEGP